MMRISYFILFLLASLCNVTAQPQVYTEGQLGHQRVWNARMNSDEKLNKPSYWLICNIRPVLCTGGFSKKKNKWNCGHPIVLTIGINWLKRTRSWRYPAILDRNDAKEIFRYPKDITTSTNTIHTAIFICRIKFRIQTEATAF